MVTVGQAEWHFPTRWRATARISHIAHPEECVSTASPYHARFLPFSAPALRTHSGQGACGQNPKLCDSQNGNLALYANDIYFCDSSSGKKPYAAHLGSRRARRTGCERDRRTGARSVRGWLTRCVKPALAGPELSLHSGAVLRGVLFFLVIELWEIKVKRKRSFLWPARCAHICGLPCPLHRYCFFAETCLGASQSPNQMDGQEPGGGSA